MAGSPATTAWTTHHTKEEYARYESGRVVITTNTVEGYFFKEGHARGVSAPPPKSVQKRKSKKGIRKKQRI